MGHVGLLAALKIVAIGPTRSDAKKPNTSSGTERFNIRQYYSGMFPCFFAGFLSLFVPSISKA